MYFRNIKRWLDQVSLPPLLLPVIVHVELGWFFPRSITLYWSTLKVIGHFFAPSLSLERSFCSSSFLLLWKSSLIVFVGQQEGIAYCGPKTMMQLHTKKCVPFICGYFCSHVTNIRSISKPLVGEIGLWVVMGELMIQILPFIYGDILDCRTGKVRSISAFNFLWMVQSWKHCFFHLSVWYGG